MAASMGPDLARFIERFVKGDVHRARDLVQDTLLAAWRHLPDLREPQLLRAWLYRVAYRNTMSSLRRRGPRGKRVLPLESGPAQELESPPIGDRPLWRVAGDWSDSEDLTPQLRTTLAELPPRYAMPLKLHYYEEMGLRQTALVLGINVQTLKMRLHRARALLRERVSLAERARRFRAAPGRGGPASGRPPRPAVHRALIPPLPPLSPHPTPGIAPGGAS